MNGTNVHRVEVFFDGDCPLCLKEIQMLRAMDRKDRILFTDIAAADFDAGAYGKSQAEFMARIQGRGAEGEWLEGVEVFRQLYSAVGLGPLVLLTRLPGLAQLLDLGYVWFAKNRLRLTGRCEDEGVCQPPEIRQV